MKILIITSNSIGIKTFRLNLIEALVRSGFEVAVLGPKDQHSDAIKSEILDKIGVKYIEFYINNTSFNLIKDLKTLWQIGIHIFKFNPDKILNYTIKPILYGGVVSRIMGFGQTYSFVTGMGYLFTSDDSGKSGILSSIFKKALNLVFCLNKRVVFQNKEDMAIFEGKCRNDKFALIRGSGVDTNFYKYTPPKNKGYTTFLFVGRILKHKGIEEFVGAAQALKPQYPKAKFVVVGDFSPNPSAISRDIFESWVESGVIEYRGYKENIIDELQDCDVFVLPSYREGLSKSILEAMSVGRPIITSDAPGCVDVIEDGKSGIIVETGSVESLKNAMISIIDHFDLQKKMGKSARELAENLYSSDIIVRQTMEVIGIKNSL